MPDFDVIVVGLGAIGAATLAELAHRGVRVLGIDRFNPPHDLGSSHGESRIFRIAYYEHPDYVPLLQRAFVRWCEVQERAGETLLGPTGGLWIGRPDSPLIGDTRAAAERYGLAHEVLSADEVADRLPQFSIRPDHVGFFEPDAGTLLPEACIATFLDLARNNGASLRTSEAMMDFSCDGTSVSINTRSGQITTDQVIMCAGAWSGRLLEDLGVPLTVTRQPVAWFKVHESARFQPEVLPCWAVEKNEHGFYYGFPLVAGGDAMKVSIHEVREAVDPDTVNREVSDSELAELERFLDGTLPNQCGPAVRRSICLYTITPDGHFIIDRHPKHERMLIACGFSGHGFKFAPVIGDALADLVTNGRTDLPIDFLSMDRFT